MKSEGGEFQKSYVLELLVLFLKVYRGIFVEDRLEGGILFGE